MSSERLAAKAKKKEIVREIKKLKNPDWKHDVCVWYADLVYHLSEAAR